MEEVFVFKTLNFNTSAGAFCQIMCCLVCLFLCSDSQVYEFTIRICSLAIADQNPCIYTSGWVVQATQITYVSKNKLTTVLICVFVVIFSLHTLVFAVVPRDCVKPISNL